VQPIAHTLFTDGVMRPVYETSAARCDFVTRDPTAYRIGFFGRDKPTVINRPMTLTDQSDGQCHSSGLFLKLSTA